MNNLRPLSKELQEIACSELNEVPERVSQDLQDFKEWLKKQPHLNARMDDQLLISFLRGCKYSMEKAKLKIDRYYTLKTKYPDFYTIQNVSDARVKEIIELGIILLLPEAINTIGPRLLYVRTKNYPFEKFTVSDIVSVGNAFQELCMRDDDCCVIFGYIIIFDMSEFSGAHLMQITPTVVKKIATFAEHAVPLRDKAIHIINVPAGFDRIFNTFKHLMPLKQQQRIFVHGSDLSSLYQHIPQKYLPRNLGGENGYLDEIIQDDLKKFEQNRKYFHEDHIYRVEEKLRREKILDYDNVFGIQGSFRKLNVD